MYSEFEKFNNKRICDLQNQQRALNDKLATHDKPYGTNNNMCYDLSREKVLLDSPFTVNGSCTNIETDYSLGDMCKGYACDKKSFYHQPERLNTYHNYLVMREDGKAVCTKNHQYFNNWTKRHHDTPQIRDTKAVGFADIPRIPSLKFNIC